MDCKNNITDLDALKQSMTATAVTIERLNALC